MSEYINYLGHNFEIIETGYCFCRKCGRDSIYYCSILMEQHNKFDANYLNVNRYLVAYNTSCDEQIIKNIMGMNYLGHDFIFKRKIIGQVDQYICNKCELSIHYRSSDKTMWIFNSSGISIELNISCDEYIIKNIIE